MSGLVRDVGVIGLPDHVVLADGPLSPPDWELMNRHPVIGAEMLAGLPMLQEAAPIVRCHHERWDGDGYPDGLRGESIPLLARVIAVCDAFVAMASDRPYRRGIAAELALERVEQDRERQFDPRVVEALAAVLAPQPVPGRLARRASGHPVAQRGSSLAPDEARAQAHNIKDVLAELDTVPVFEPALNRLLQATRGDGSALGRDLVLTIESDLGLTIAVLRAAQGSSPGGRVRSVADAVRALSPEQIEHAALAVPRAAFPWRTPFEALLHRLRIHSHLVARAAERIARELELKDPDELLTVALLHDIGKLALNQVRPELAGSTDAKTRTPEQRLQAERHALRLDHASLGALQLRRWNLPSQVVDSVADHHTAGKGGQTATLVRLADLIAHHAQGDAVDRDLLIDLAGRCGLAPQTVKDVLFDLPHAGGSRRARAQPSPLTHQQTAALRHLAQGKVYSQIADDLNVSPSTIRSHLHLAYKKMQVPDRAQAVLRAIEMGWI